MHSNTDYKAMGNWAWPTAFFAASLARNFGASFGNTENALNRPVEGQEDKRDGLVENM
jgi:hypothetical protein